MRTKTKKKNSKKMKSFDYFLIIFILLFTSIGLTTSTLIRIDEPNQINKLEILGHLTKDYSTNIGQYLRNTNLSDECANKIIQIFSLIIFNQTDSDLNDLFESTPCINLLLEFIKNELISSTVSMPCQTSVNTFFKSLFQLQVWTFLAIDSIGKQSSGIFTSSFYKDKWIGEYDECINIKETNWNGKYCSFITFDKDLMPGIVKFLQSFVFVRGFCASTQCSKYDISVILNHGKLKFTTIIINIIRWRFEVE